MDAERHPSVSRRAARALAVLLLVLVVEGGARLGAAANEDAQYIERVVAAARAGDRGALGTLARERPTGPDPWGVVDRLHRETLPEAAGAYARAIEAPDAAALRAYAEALPAVPAALHAAIDMAALAYGEENPDPVVDLLGDIPVGPLSVPRARRAFLLGWARAARGEFGEAEGQLAEGLADAVALGWLVGQDLIHHARFHAFQAQGELGAALGALDERRRIQQALQSPEERGLIDRYEGALLVRLGRPRDAVPLLDRALEQLDRSAELADRAQARVQVAVARASLGEYARALSLCETAIGQAADADDVQTLLYAETTRVSIFMDMGRTREAQVLAGPLLARDDLHPILAAANRCHLAMALAYDGKRAAASTEFGKAIDTFRRAGVQEYVGWVRMVRALVVHCEAGAWDEALREADEALASVAPASDDAAYCHYVAGIALAGRSAWDAAEERLTTALRIADDQDLLDLQSFCLGRLAQVALGRGKPAEAVVAARRAAAALELCTAGLADEEGIAVRCDRERSRLFTLWVRAARALPAKERAAAHFEAIEAGRARLLLAAIGGGDKARGLDLPPGLRAEEAVAQAELIEAHADYDRLRRLGARPKELSAARARNDAARWRWAMTIGRIQRASGARAAMAYPPSNSLADVQGALAREEAMVLFEVDDEQDTAFALTVRADGAASLAVEDWPAVRALCMSIPNASTEEEGNPFDEQGRALGKALLGALGLPERIERVFLAPAGPLTQVPWSALPQVRDGGPDIALIPSAATWLALRSRAPVPGTHALAFADAIYSKPVGTHRLPRIPGTAREAEAIRRPGDLVFVREAASETKFKELVGREEGWRLLLCACHGVVDEEAPCLTSLVLTPDKHEDGLLTATEVFGLRARSRFTILSACDVGRAGYARGEGLLGLIRSFMAAGSPRLLASLWPADDDATVHLITEFERHREAGKSPHAALRLAQEAVRTKKDPDGGTPWALPYYWAGWVLWGPSAK